MNENNQHDESNVVPPFAEPASQHSANSVTKWMPVTRAGQVQKGDKLRFTIGDKSYSERAKMILHAGTDKEEVIYDKGHNYYFITSMILSGFSNHKGVQVLASRCRAQGGNTILEGLTRYTQPEYDYGMDEDADGEYVKFADVAAHLAGQSQATLEDSEQYRLQMAAIASAAIGYWTESTGIKPEYDTPVLREVAKLYAKYEALYESQATKVQAVPIHQVKSLLHPHGWHDTDWQSYEWNKENKQEVRIVYAAPVAKEVQSVPDHDQALKLAEQAGFINSAGYIMPPRQYGHITSEVVKLVQLSAAPTGQATKVQAVPAVVQQALDIALDLAMAEADNVHKTYAGYKQHKHDAADRDVETIKRAIDAINPTAQEVTQQAAPEVPLWDDNGEPWNEAAEKVERERLTQQAAKAETAEQATADDIAQLPGLMDEWANAPRGKAARAVYARIVKCIDSHFLTPTTSKAAEAAITCTHKYVRDEEHWEYECCQLCGNVKGESTAAQAVTDQAKDKP